MLRKGTLKILAVEASMIFLAITVKGIAAENETAHAQRIVVTSERTMVTDTQEPVEPETITVDQAPGQVRVQDQVLVMMTWSKMFLLPIWMFQLEYLH